MAKLKKQLLIVGWLTLAVALAFGGVLAHAQSFPGTGIRRVVDALYEYTGSQIFDSNVTVVGNLAVTGTQTFTGATTIPTATVTTGNITTLNVSGTSTLASPIVTGSLGKGVIAFGGPQTLTEAAGAETIFTLTNATTQMSGGTLHYTVRIADSAGSPDYTVRAGTIQFAMTNSAGTTVCSVSGASQAADASALAQGGTAKTNLYAITFVAAANTCLMKFNIDSDIATVTSASIDWIAIVSGIGTIS